MSKKRRSSEPASDPFPFPKIIVLIFLAVAGLMLAISAITAVSTGLALAKEKSAPGTIVDLVARPANDERGTVYYYPVVEFYSPDETHHLVQLSEGSWPPAYEKGQEVTVLYDPARPLDARIKSTSSAVLRWIAPAITGILGVVFLIVALLVRRFLMSGPADSAS